MIEFELTKDLQRLTGLTVWPLLLPEHAQEGVTLLQCQRCQGRYRPGANRAG
ncbi:hypothetical protein SODG_001806 [Sodalis praecaptivus]